MIKPILFNTEMVRGLLNGTKTVTRRVVKPQPEKGAHSPYECVGGRFAFRIGDRACTNQYKPPYRPGDILYVRETWTHTCIHCEHYPDMFFCPPDCGTCPEFAYKADGGSLEGWPDKRWHPSIHMPREAARIFLRVTDVRVERLQSITELDILEKEGVTVDFPQPKPSYMSLAYTETRLKPAIRKSFADLWNSTIKKADRGLYGWEANPWVWVIEFERCENPEGDRQCLTHTMAL